MARIDLRQSPLVALVRQSVLSTKIPILAGLTCGIVLLFLRYAPYAPLPFETPLIAPPDWASWFDAYITFPILIILCLLPFRNSRGGSAILVSTVATIPLYLVIASYFFYYAQTPLGLWTLVIPLTLLVPTAVLFVILAAPLINSLVLARGLRLDREDRLGLSLNRVATRLYFFAIAALSVGLALLQAYLRSTIPGVALTSWVSDVGISVDAGARYLVSGINPYTHSIPPWGGTGATYGPVTYLLAVPFTFLPAGWAAHVSALVYALITSVGIWKSMQLFSARYAAICAAFFLALPTTSWAVEVGMTSHLGLAALIVWSLFLFLNGKSMWSGLICSVGLLTLLIPGFLVIPYLTAARNRPSRLRMIAGFLIPIVLTMGFLLTMFPTRFLFSEAETAYGNFGAGWLTPDLIFSPAVIKAISIIATGWLVFWLIYASSRARNDSPRFLAIIATFLLVIPFAAANYFAFFYVWGSAVALITIFCLMANQQRLTGSGREQPRVSC
jgi:Glycosyltransferase family 87